MKDSEVIPESANRVEGDTPPPRYYHGGPKGLREVLPPCLTGAPSSASYGAAAVCRRDRVYVTTSLEAAIGFASLAPPSGDGAVYEVEPLNPADDPDCSFPGLSYEAGRARIIRRVSIPGKTLKLARKLMVSAP